MLKTLIVKNFAIIEHNELHFGEGLNIISGETGSGKSILLKSLSTILGEKNVSDYIRKGSEQAEIQAFFLINKKSEIYNILKEKELLHEDDEETLHIRKIIKQKGTSVWVNGVASSNAFLSQISNELIQALSQNQQQKLTQASEQIKLLDHSINDDFFNNLSEKLSKAKKLETSISQLQKDSKYKDDRISYIKHLLKDLQSFDLSMDDTELENKINLIENSQFFMEELTILEGIIYEDGIVDKASTLKRRLQKIVNKVPNEELNSTLEKVDELLNLTEEIGSIFIKNKDSLDSDPEEMNELIEKSKIIKKLKQKFGSIEQMKEQISTLENELNYLTGIDISIKEQKEERESLITDCLKISSQISEQRKKVAAILEKEITKELQTLNMKGSSLKIEFSNQELTYSGTDKISFLISSNKGEDFKPLAQIASGGELSRIMLAMHKCMSKETSNCFLLDEVDQGISGDTGTIIGKKLQELSKKNQVIAITHLPQVALFADNHFVIEKSEINGRVVSLSVELNDVEKEKELARLLGHSLNEKSALAHAKELLKSKNK